MGSEHIEGMEICLSTDKRNGLGMQDIAISMFNKKGFIKNSAKLKTKVKNLAIALRKLRYFYLDNYSALEHSGNFFIIFQI